MNHFLVSFFLVITFSQASLAWTGKILACSDEIESYKKDMEVEGPGDEACKKPAPPGKAIWKTGSTWRNCKPQNSHSCSGNPSLKMIECEREYDCVVSKATAKPASQGLITDPTVIKELDSAFGLESMPAGLLSCEKSEVECLCDNRKEIVANKEKALGMIKKYPAYSGKSVQYKLNGMTATIDVPTQAQVEAKKFDFSKCK